MLPTPSAYPIKPNTESKNPLSLPTAPSIQPYPATALADPAELIPGTCHPSPLGFHGGRKSTQSPLACSPAANCVVFVFPMITTPLSMRIWIADAVVIAGVLRSARYARLWWEVGRPERSIMSLMPMRMPERGRSGVGGGK